MSAQPIALLADGLICCGLVFGISFSVRQKKKTIAPMNSSVATPDQLVAKFWRSVTKPPYASITRGIGSPPKALSLPGPLLDALEPVRRRVAAADLRAAAPVDDHHVGSEVVGAAQQRRADAV